MTDVLCAIDSRPVGDNAYICQSCTTRLERSLGDVRWGQICLVNVKRTTPPGPGERADLLRVAGYIDAVPLVAFPDRLRLLVPPMTEIPYGWHPRRQPGESDEAAIDRFVESITDPDPDDAPNGWEP